MKLAIVIGSLSRGGSERQIVELVRAAHPEYAECVVICLSSDAGALAQEVRETGARVFTIGFDGARSWGTPGALLRLAKTLRVLRPDVVYAFLFWSHVLALPLAAVGARHAKRVAALRSSPTADVPSNRLLVGLRRPALSLAHGAIANSDPVATEWVTAYPRLAGRISVVPNGVRMTPISEPGASEDGGPPTIVCVANLSPHKGHRTLFEALARLRCHRWTLLLVGDGPQRSALETVAGRLELTQRVHFLGAVSNVWPVLGAADLAVLPSYTEGLPNAVLEAMAHGVPVVATDVGGVRSLLASGAGTVVPPKDVGGLSAAICSYLEDPRLRARAGRRGYDEARCRYSIPAMRDRTLRAIEAISS